MKKTNIELPLTLLRAAGLEGKNIFEKAVRLSALDFYREDEGSFGRSAELCQTPLVAFMDFAASHGVPPLRDGYRGLGEKRQSSDCLKA
jgi:Uncharacterised protein family (UPF0175)